VRKQAGITLVELLIAAAILLLLLAAVSALYLVSTRAYETNREVTASAAQLRTAIQAIQSDFGQAGFTGRDQESLAGAAPLTFGLGEPYCLDGEEPPCARQLDWLTLRYAADPESSTVRTVSYSVEGGELLQASDGAGPLPIAEGINGLDAIAFIRDSRNLATVHASPPADLAGFSLRLRYQQSGTERSEEFSVVLP